MPLSPVASSALAVLASGCIELLPFSSLPRPASILLDTLLGHGALSCLFWALGSSSSSSAAAAAAAAASAPLLSGAAPPPASLLPSLLAAAASSPATSALASLCCGLASVALDGDHFLAAGSLRLSAALSLPGRPFGHSLLFVLAASAALRAGGSACGLPPWAWAVCAVAWCSHLLRDALRRGLWLWPLPHTQPLPMLLYLAACAAVPLLVKAYCEQAAAAAAASSRAQPPLLPR